MKSGQIFIGPLLRRAQPDAIVICLATIVPINLKFSVREFGKKEWLGHDDAPFTVNVSPNLIFYFGRVTPSDKLFPTNRLMEYGIGELNVNEVADYAPFEKIVKEDGLAYGNNPLPTFFLQGGSKKLNVLYGSCRKIHDANGGKVDALSHGDTVVSDNWNDLEKRPAILCLGGDQIYADDVAKEALIEIMALASVIEVADPEKLPGSASAPGIDRRKDFVTNKAKFTSGESKNHLITFAEYLAIYGLMWNRSNWVTHPSSLNHFTDTLGKVRRLLANIPTYMIFDDHDVTDDWNLCAEWKKKVFGTDLGKRIVTNGLMAFWLCQGYGNGPYLYSDQEAYAIADIIRDRNKDYNKAENLFWGLDKWEFFTPTYPFVYFLDTRTQRGLKDGPTGTDLGAPAYLKSLDSWAVTYKTLQHLLKRQNKNLPLVLVAPAPVFGFKFVETLQGLVSAIAMTPNFLDLESWAANTRHLMLFLQLMGDANVVLLSGDVHYAFTSTVKFIMFDDKTLRDAIKLMPSGTSLPKNPTGATPTYEPLWTAHFIQLTSSALKNFASTAFTQTPANLTTMEPALILTEDGEHELGKFENGEFTVYESNPFDDRYVKVKEKKEDLKPARLYRQRINDRFNSHYVGEHNIGVASFQDKTVTNYFYTANGKQTELTWDFSNDKLFE